MIELTVNGKLRQIEGTQTILGFLESRELLPRMVVVEHNGVIVPRDQYGEVILQAGDNLEIVQMMAGG